MQIPCEINWFILLLFFPPFLGVFVYVSVRLRHQNIFVHPQVFKQYGRLCQQRSCRRPDSYDHWCAADRGWCSLAYVLLFQAQVGQCFPVSVRFPVLLSTTRAICFPEHFSRTRTVNFPVHLSTTTSVLFYLCSCPHLELFPWALVYKHDCLFP